MPIAHDRIESWHNFMQYTIHTHTVRENLIRFSNHLCITSMYIFFISLSPSPVSSWHLSQVSLPCVIRQLRKTNDWRKWDGTLIPIKCTTFDQSTMGPPYDTFHCVMVEPVIHHLLKILYESLWQQCSLAVSVVTYRHANEASLVWIYSNVYYGNPNPDKLSSDLKCMHAFVCILVLFQLSVFQRGLL